MFLLYNHPVLIIKYRKNVFYEEMSDNRKDIIIRLSKNYNIKRNQDIDTVHISSSRNI
ncbi:transposase [Bacillus cereus]|uniref:transposase n=1 Tax=Bacillus cereus TaxID=1396 RepID=UPI00240731C3|nr:transposase [Bacillus cereus]MDF9612828.1 transposase [Bacillus cereus]